MKQIDAKKLRDPSEWGLLDRLRYNLAGFILGKRLWQEFRKWEKSK